MPNLKRINHLEVQVGDIVHFYGARSKIMSRREYEQTDELFIKMGRTKLVSALGKWLDGDIIPGYFGPERDWHFQGNCGGFLYIEERS